MLGEITRVKRNLVKSLVVKTTCTYDDMPKVIGESYGKIMPYMTAQGAMPAGAPYVAYTNQDMNALDIEVGMPVGMYVPDTEEVIMSEIPEGEYVRAIFTGPYDTLKLGYKAMSEFMNEEGLEVKDAVYETYLNDPGDTPPEKLKTEILFSIKVD